MTHKKVLCFESHANSMAVLQSMLKELGYEAMVANSASQAFDVLRQNIVEGILLEYDLPAKLCALVRAEAKRIQPEVPVVLFAGMRSQTILTFFEQHSETPSSETTRHA